MKMAKILVRVFVPSEQRLRTLKEDLQNWDTYGAAESLDTELPKFKRFLVNPPTDSVRIACSTIDPSVCWQVIIANDATMTMLGYSYFPVIALFDVKAKKDLAIFQGAPKDRKQVFDFLNANLSTLSSGSAKSKKVLGWGFLALLSGFFLQPKAKK